MTPRGAALRCWRAGGAAGRFCGCGTVVSNNTFARSVFMFCFGTQTHRQQESIPISAQGVFVNKVLRTPLGWRPCGKGILHLLHRFDCQQAVARLLLTRTIQAESPTPVYQNTVTLHSPVCLVGEIASQNVGLGGSGRADEEQEVGWRRHGAAVCRDIDVRRPVVELTRKKEFY